MAIERAEKIAKAGAMTEQSAKRILSEILERTTGVGLSDHKAGAWLVDWAEGKRASRETSTAARYQQVVRNFKHSLGERAKLSLSAITAKDILTFRKRELDAGKSPKTANNAVRCLSAALNAAVRLQVIPSNPCLAVDSLEENSTARDTFTPAQLAALLATAEGDWRRAIAFGYYTGARLGDVASMRWSMIDLKAGTISFRPKKTKRKIRQVVIPIHPELEKALLKAPGVGSATVFPSLIGKATGGCSGLSAQFHKIMTDAGITAEIRRHAKDKGRQNKSLSFHSLRHSFNSALANADVSQELRMKLTGHTKAETNTIYTHHEVAALRRAVEKIPIPA